MPSFKTSRVVRHAANEMFALVADVESYPAFVPLCTDLRVLKRATDEQGRGVVTAAMGIGYKAIQETFTSRIVLDRSAQTIVVSYVDGPFRRMENRWTFVDAEPGPDGSPRSTVGFFLDYEFRSMTFGLLMGAVFDAAFRRFAEAFERRADVVYKRGIARRRRDDAGGQTPGNGPPLSER